ncbi:MAG: aminotransferase class I/II-fold pyridoxal phosphate-dependent enzyme [Gracilimonas sp.]|uniref:Aminotransferase class I/II-fold pyridoxal phosphate-dependent enzyme n=1 Tax=Gracilimonas sediminicola TaxID=2952158 RepID=A0A9X2L622_9BACT|nr:MULTISPECIES: aminotransferase class I/II-fold pyridoxal phosphate-dependent enzyme [Gracilimonas]MBO6585858.1 aminotransferase class I/II-fold pyridoxal phosphate-dependent enzyme [Gracilimonas sp.]MBO6616855.1 aminotransferase class I/II-fold pyridoxal phosphate-dependent enzyme [Gracilimonas sp.]MCP9292218.1 aminotransferase class I/II-fold pyridoxal phosphate-dependent enzyme [Gracilimonas sediminicola]
MADQKSSATKSDIFSKAFNFTKADEVKEMGLYPYFKPLEATDGTIVEIEGKKVIMAGSNNYLGLTNDQRTIKAAQDALKKYGTGCTGSRYLNGTLDSHLELEDKLAKFMGKEGCVLFSTGYQTNEGAIQTIADRNDIIFSDKDNHACIVVGTLVSNAKTMRYKHNDMDQLRKLLERADPDAGKIIVTDGVFSMSGTLAKVPELVKLAKEFNARLYLDDAHAVGVVGDGGRGSASVFGLTDEVDLISGTFSKSFASLGGFLVGDRPVIEYIRHKSPAHIFSASMPPANVATVLKVLEILQEETWRLDRLEEIANYMRKELRGLGFNVWSSQSPIIPVVIGEMMDCFKFWKDLFEEGVYTNAVVPPAVPQGQSLLRTSYMASHTDEHLDQILEAFRKVGLKHGVIDRNGHSATE